MSYQERVQLSLVPLLKGIGHFIVAHAQHVLHDMVSLADELKKQIFSLH